MTLQITGLYAAILTVMFLALTYWVILKRAQTGVSIMHGEDKGLALRIRQHGNFIENVPLALILLGIAETAGAGPTWLHAVGAGLVVSRLMHAVGLKVENATHPLRILGALGTHVALIVCVVIIVTG